MNEDRLAKIEANQVAASEEMKTHQLNDSLEFGKAAKRDEEMATMMVGLATKEDIQSLKPILEALAGGKIAITLGRGMYKTMLVLGSLAMALVAIRALFTGNITIKPW